MLTRNNQYTYNIEIKSSIYFKIMDVETSIPQFARSTSTG